MVPLGWGNLGWARPPHARSTAAAARIIVFAWVNDTKTLRTYGSKTDAYAVFRSMLDRDTPPDDWVALLKAASEATATTRLDDIGHRQSGNAPTCQTSS